MNVPWQFRSVMAVHCGRSALAAGIIAAVAARLMIAPAATLTSPRAFMMVCPVLGLLGCGVEGVHYLSGDASPGGDLHTVAGCPFADFAGGRADLGALPGLAGGLADASGCAHVLAESFAELGGVLAGQVDLVVDAVECDRQGLGGFCAVDVVRESDGNFLCHNVALFQVGVLMRLVKGTCLSVVKLVEDIFQIT